MPNHKDTSQFYIANISLSVLPSFCSLDTSKVIHEFFPNLPNFDTFGKNSTIHQESQAAL